MFPERKYQSDLFDCLEILYRVSRNTAVQKSIRVFVIVGSSLFS